MGKAVVLTIGCFLVVGACGEEDKSLRGGATGGVESGGASSGGADLGGTAETGGRATGGRASGGQLGSGGDPDVPAGAAGEAVAGAAGAGGSTGTGGATEVGGAGGAPAECWAEPAGAPNLAVGGEAGASGETTYDCWQKACEINVECGFGRGELCVGCASSLPKCSCLCYRRFRACGPSCEQFSDCVDDCLDNAC